MTTLYFAGAETPSWKKALSEHGVEHVSISYWNLRNRLPKKKAYVLADRYPDEQHIFLDSGAFSANKDTSQDLSTYHEAYLKFVRDNLERIDFAAEFNYAGFTEHEIEQTRDEFWATLGDKALVLWNPDTGFKGLESLCQRFDRVGIPEQAFETHHGLRTRLFSLGRQYGVQWHGAGISSPELLRTVQFATVSSTSWVSPMRYGETVLWDGLHLRRYSASMKSQARKRHRQTFERLGFDAGKIDKDDQAELARLSIWSWQQLEIHLAKQVKRRKRTDVEEPQVVDTFEDGEDGLSEQSDLEHVDTSPAEAHKRQVATSNVPARAREERQNLPVFSVNRQTTEIKGEDGEVMSQQTTTDIRANPRSMRVCDTCYVAANCPAMVPGSECAFDFPFEIKSKDDLLSMLNAMLEMQTQRVAFGRFVEEREGGYPDPNLSSEIDRLFRITENLKNIEDTREYAKLTVETRSGAGALSRLWGDAAGETLKALPAPLDHDSTDSLAATVLEGEVLEEL